MARKSHVTFGIQGQHEFYAPTTGNGQKNRRDRKKCHYYVSELKLCSKIGNKCVGPTICRSFKVQEVLNEDFVSIIIDAQSKPKLM